MTTLHDALAMVLEALDRDDVAQAEALCSQLTAQVPHDADLLHLAAAVADRQGDHAQAGRLRRRAIVAAAVAKAGVFRAMGNIGEARRYAEEALKIDTYNRGACDLLGALNQIPAPPDGTSLAFRRTPLNLFRTKLGAYFLPSDAPNDAIILRMKAGQIFEEEIVDALRPHVRRATVVVDVGANLGQMSLLFSEMVGPRGRVYSIEADDYIHAVLRKNIEVNGRVNITPIQAAAYDRAGETVLFPRQDFREFAAYGSYGIDPKASEGRAVETITIDGLAIEQPISAIKVDVQGSDLFAMRGARETIRRHRPVVIFEYEEQFQERFGTSHAEYMAFIEEVGYRVERTINGINYLIVPKD